MSSGGSSDAAAISTFLALKQYKEAQAEKKKMEEIEAARIKGTGIRYQGGSRGLGEAKGRTLISQEDWIGAETGKEKVLTDEE